MKKIRFLIAVMLAYFLAVMPAIAALTVDNWKTISLGNKRMKIAQVDFDSSYAFGGEAFDYTQYGFVNVDIVKITAQNGVTFEYDYTNKKIKAFVQAPPVVMDEQVQLTAGAGTLQYPAAFIMYISANSTPYKVIPGGLTPATGQVSVSEPVWGTRNTLTFSPTDIASGAIKGKCSVSYITQAWKEVFDNYVLATLTAGARVSGHANLQFTAGTPDNIRLGEQAVAIQSVCWNDNGTYKAMKPVSTGETAATTEFTIDYAVYNNGTPETRLTVLQTDTLDASTDTVYIQYIKKPASGPTSSGNAFITDHFVDPIRLPASGTTASIASGSTSIGQTIQNIGNMLLFGTAGSLPGPTGYYVDLLSASESPSGANEAILSTYNSSPNIFTFGQSGPALRSYLTPSYIYGTPDQIPNLVPLEATNGADLSDITNVRVEIIGW